MTATRLSLSAQEAAEALGVSVHTVRAWTKQGRLPCSRIGRRVLYRVRDLEEALQEASAPAAHPSRRGRKAVAS